MQPYQYDTAPSKGKEPAGDNDLASSQPVSFPRKGTITRPRISHYTFSRPGSALVISQTTPNLAAPQGRGAGVYHSSATWTSSSGDINLVSEVEEIDDRERFVDEYNRLAKKVFGLLGSCSWSWLTDSIVRHTTHHPGGLPRDYREYIVGWTVKLITDVWFR
jgi:hypothetical protein